LSAFPTLIQCSTRIPSQNSKTGEKIKETQIGKEEVKLSLFAQVIVSYQKDFKNSLKIDRCHKHVKQSSEIQMQYKKSIAFLYTNNEVSYKEIRKTMPFTIALKIKISINKFNEASESHIQ
jgi:hypothetical protein